MTSGVFHSLPVDSIEIHREARQRRDISRTDDLEDSIARLGLIHPIVVTREKVLVAGERRLTAIKKLGWDRVPVQYTDEVEPRMLAAIELEENIKRRDIPWQDQVAALSAFHELHKEDDPTWTMEQTGEAIGIGKMAVSEQLSIAKKLESGDVRVASADRLSTARSIVRRDKERKRHDEAIVMKEVIRPPELVTCEDFNKWAPAYDGPPFNFIHCDFPYGIDVAQGAQVASHLGKYNDSFATYEALLNTLDEQKEKLCGSSCHLLFWFSMNHYQYTWMRLKEIGFWVDPLPFVWHKDDNSGTLPWPDRSARRVYETAFICSWGDRPIIQSVSNVFAAPLVRLGEHMSEKSEAMLRYVLGMFVNEHSRVLDPTCGSGSSLRAALRLGAKHVVGLELDPEFCKAANDLLATRKR
jgi:ParB/RepB/Spo0J family partition protein